MTHAAHMEILPFAGRIGRGEILPQHVGNGNAHFMAGARISNHRAYLIGLAIQCMNIADRNGFLAGSEPRFGKDSLPDPTSQGNVM